MRINTRSGSTYTIGPLGDVTRNGEFIGLLHTLSGGVGEHMILTVVVRKGQDSYDKVTWTTTTVSTISTETALEELVA